MLFEGLEIEELYNVAETVFLLQVGNKKGGADTMVGKSLESMILHQIIHNLDKKCAPLERTKFEHELAY